MRQFSRWAIGSRHETPRRRGRGGTIVGSIRGDGHDVRWMAEDLEGAKDDVILEAAVQDSRILITEDKDFGELVYR